MATPAPTQKIPHHKDIQRQRALRLAVGLTVVTGLGLVLGSLFLALTLPAWALWAGFSLAYLAGGLPATREALLSLRRGEFDIDLLMVLAALAAAAVGEPRDGAILLFLFSLAETLEDYAMGRTERAVSSLLELRPEVAHRRIGRTQTEDVAVEALEPGDIVVVKPGERIPADGEVVQGRSAIDESPLTGESTPVDKAPGDGVFAATLNGYGALELRVTKRADESTLARMIALVTEAQSQRAPSQRFSDWFGQRYTVMVLLGSALALTVFFLLGMPRGDAFYKAATLLVVASPCAIVISVPAAILSALATAARAGVLFKGGAALEDFGDATLLAVDKTGTLTEGRPKVTDLDPFAVEAETLLRLAATVEARSEHPIARSIVEEAEAKGLSPYGRAEVEAVPGHGVVATLPGKRLWVGSRKLARSLAVPLDPEVEAALGRLEAQGKTAVLVGDRERVLGIIAVADTVRRDAKRALQALRAAGLRRIVMLTGDHARAAYYIGAQLAIPVSDIHAGLLPEDKVELVRSLRQSGKVAFLGDGVNDAAALASADVGIAMGTAGSDAAIEAADVALLADDLGKLETAYVLAQRTTRVVKQNLFFAVGAMVTLVLWTLFGNLPLPLGVVGHEGGTLVVVANGLRLLGRRPNGARQRSARPTASHD